MKYLLKYKTALIALFTRGIGMALQFVTSLVLVRALGPAGVGMYSLYTSWMMVLSSAAGVGTTTYTLRSVSVMAGKDQFSEIRKFLKKLTYFLLATGLTLLLAVWPFSDTLSKYILGDTELSLILIFSAIASIIFMIQKAYAEAMKGMHLINLALLIETAFLPSLIIILAGWYVWSDKKLDIGLFLSGHILFLTLTTGIMIFFILRGLNKKISVDTETSVPLLSRSLLPLWGSGLLGMWFMNMPIILLPHFTDPHEIGIFSMAYRLITITVNILMVLASIYGPQFARDFSSKNISALKSGLKQTQRISILLYLPLFSIFLIFPKQVMSIFGQEFQAGSEWLVIMALGQLIYASTGLVGFMMNMIHQEHQEFQIMIGASIFMLTICIILGYFYGTTGISIGFAIGLAAKNITSLYFVKHHLKNMSSENYHINQ